jgi:hypothetical protein
MTPEQSRWLTDTVTQYLPFVLVGVIAWNVLVMLFVRWNRKRLGLPIGKPELPNTLFTESWTSTGLTNNAAWVILTEDFLQVGLHLPFCLLFPIFMSRALGSDVKVPVEKVTRLEIASGLLGHSIQVTWRDSTGTRSARIRARDLDTLVAKLRAAAAAKGAALR